MTTIFVHHRERGASLLVSLMFMVIMAMISVSVANVGVLEERMTGGTRDRDIALQAAEAAQRDAEMRLQTDAAFRSAASGFDATRANTAAFWESCFSGAAAPCDTKYTPTTSLPTTGNGAVASQPQFVLERKADIPNGVNPPIQVYRVTARAVGGSSSTVVVLQGEYTYTP